MTVADPVLSSTHPAEEQLQSSAPLIVFMGFISEMWKLPSVKKTAWSTEEGEASLWVMMAEENLEEQERVHMLKQEYRRKRYFPIDVRVVNLSRVSEASLPASTVLFAR
jgi:hypothetical protein